LGGNGITTQASSFRVLAAAVNRYETLMCAADSIASAVGTASELTLLLRLLPQFGRGLGVSTRPKPEPRLR
jgi:hypothetical protein